MYKVTFISTLSFPVLWRSKLFYSKKNIILGGVVLYQYSVCVISLAKDKFILKDNRYLGMYLLKIGS